MKKTVLQLCFCIGAFSSWAQNPSYQWAKNIGGNPSAKGESVAIDGAGNVYTTGNFTGVGDFDPGVLTYSLSTQGGEDVFITKLDASGNFVWAKNVGGPSDDYAYSIAADVSGNIYITGSFTGSADFDPGAGVQMLHSEGGADIFVLKLSAAGNFIWAKGMGSALDDFGYSLALDAAANVYTTGSFQGTADFDPGAAVYNLSSAGNADVFVSKLNTDGNFVYAKSMGGPDDEQSFSIAVDASGNAHTTGWFNTVADFDPGTGTANLTCATVRDIFISKLNPSGNFVWAKSIGGKSYDGGKSIGLDAAGNVYTVGFFRENVDFDPGPDYSYLNAGSGTHYFISKLDASGNFVWARNFLANIPLNGRTNVVDASGNCYLTGYFSGTIDCDPGPATVNLKSEGKDDCFISRFDNSGNLVWKAQIGGADYDYTSSLALDASNNVYATGNFAGVCDFDPHPTMKNNLSITPGNTADVFILKWKQVPAGIAGETISTDQVQLYPNPGNGIFTVQIPGTVLNNSIEITNTLGYLVYHLSEAQNTNKIDLSGLSNGIYFVTIRKEGQLRFLEKIIKQ